MSQKITLESLPNETLGLIFECCALRPAPCWLASERIRHDAPAFRMLDEDDLAVRRALVALCTVSKGFNKLCTPLLYRYVYPAWQEQDKQDWRNMQYDGQYMQRLQAQQTPCSKAAKHAAYLCLLVTRRSQDINLEGFNSLRKLDLCLDCDIRRAPSAFPGLQQPLPQLEELSLAALVIDRTWRELGKTLEFCTPNLRVLALALYNIGPADAPRSEESPPCLTRLESLHLSDIETTRDAIQSFLGSIQLEVFNFLSMDACLTRTRATLEDIPLRLRRQTRKLRWAVAPRMTGLQPSIPKLFPALETLVLDVCREPRWQREDIAFTGLPDTLQLLRIRGDDFSIVRSLFNLLSKGPGTLPQLRRVEMDMALPADFSSTVEPARHIAIKLFQSLKKRGVKVFPGTLEARWVGGRPRSITYISSGEDSDEEEYVY